MLWGFKLPIFFAFWFWWQKKTSVLVLKGLRTEVFWEKFRKQLYRTTNGTIRKCSSRAFQWIVILVGFDNLKFFWAISVSHPWWPSVHTVKELECSSVRMYFENACVSELCKRLHLQGDEANTKMLWITEKTDVCVSGSPIFHCQRSLSRKPLIQIQYCSMAWA
jgi:hypothetical protein